MEIPHIVIKLYIKISTLCDGDFVSRTDYACFTFVCSEISDERATRSVELIS